MTKVRRRVKKAHIHHASSASPAARAQDDGADVALSAQEQEQSKRFLITLGVIFALVVMTFVVLQLMR